MKKELYTSDDVLEFLSELAIGSEEVQKIETFLKRKDSQVQWQSNRVEEAHRMIGELMLSEAMMYE